MAACLVPLVVEAYNIYQLTTHLIKTLVKETDMMDVLSPVIERFYAQYIDLRTFFLDANGLKYVTAIIAVPTLPQDPPEFSVKKAKKSKKSKKDKKKKKISFKKSNNLKQSNKLLSLENCPRQVLF